MDKISGIIKSSPRVASVDMKEASPVRPGTPTFGRPEGVSSLKQPELPSLPVESTARRGIAAQEQLMDWRSKDAKQAALAVQVSDSFFMKNNRPADAVVEAPRALDMRALSPASVSSRPAGFKDAAPSVMQPFEDEAPVQLQQPEGLYPKGSFIDRSV